MPPEEMAMSTVLSEEHRRRTIEGKRQSNRRVDRSDGDGVGGYWFRAAQAAGVSSASRWMEVLAKPGNTAPR